MWNSSGKNNTYESVSQTKVQNGQTCLRPVCKQMRNIKYIFVFSCTLFVCSLLWVQLVAKDTQYTFVYGAETEAQDPKWEENHLKYILLWPESDYAPLSFFQEGQKSFIDKNCSVTNCYVAVDRYFFGKSFNKFDAIAFNGRTININDLPRVRSIHQKYIYFNMESSDNYPLCQAEYDGFFNWTSTYRLDSDIPIPYLLVRDKMGAFVAPKRDVHWINDTSKIDDEFVPEIGNKTKAAAWFVSNCNSRSKRHEFVKALQEALKPYGLTVDVYGNCGPFKCPRKQYAECDLKLKKEYFFYMSLENSFAEDYVTEKLLTALKNDLVPIVYGGANYSRFLPDGSYIDGRKMSPKELAALMSRLIKSPEEYKQFFKWKQHYTYHNPMRDEDVCGLCEALNDVSKMEITTVYEKFRSWWNPDYKSRC
ncbi:alpha-(1,3)-fucosyltransferase C-like isoform X1 [Anticarsia gemmatalis]|uniref:alpha-(1,3)-fucosyltransferase C-like isoform X1 n=1 Tax=Anticarsia gemmatalis TaxID=129554 RepID=UPI003F76DA9D